MESTESEIYEESNAQKSSAGIKDIVRKYIAYWPLFVLSLAIFIGGALLYLRKATPKYIATALILVKGEKKSPQEDLIAGALSGSRNNNLENELQLMRSSTTMERVVLENQFNISYFFLGRIKSSDIYLDAPFRLVLQNAGDSSKGFTLIVKNLSNAGAIIEYTPNNSVKKQVNLPWNTPYRINGKQFVLAPRGKDVANSGEFMVVWSPVAQTAGEIASKVYMDWLDKKTSIIKINILIENLQRGKDILNALAKEYDRADLEDKNIASRNTVRFIEDRLEIISRELSGVEGNLEGFQNKNQIVNVESQSGQAFGNSNTVSRDILDINIQKGVVQQIQSYFNNPNSAGKLVPSSLGIDDPTLGSLIAKYNELELKKQREKPQLSNNSLILKDIDNQINDVKGSVLENLQNIDKNLNLQQGSLEQKNNQYKQFLSSLPRKERVMLEIKRKQSITEGLYLYLLQKREESSITAGAANISTYKQIDKANGYGPVEPNSTNIMMVSVLIGLLLPIGFILLGDALNDKVSTREEIVNKLNFPIIGELSHIAKRKATGILILNRDIVGEQFRLLRTNLSLADKNGKNQVILVTSSGMDEGKSFVSLNLAAVLATPGKRVALLEFDLRKPGLSINLGYTDVKGITEYLSGHTIDLSEIYQISEQVPTLHIYPAGSKPQNPGDLLLNENMAPFFEVLKRRYDYIIIDTAPIGLVSDAFILNKYADRCVYVIRQRHTLKKQMDFINDIHANKRLNNLGLIINDVKTGGKYGSGYGYGENYGEVYGMASPKKWWQKASKSF